MLGATPSQTRPVDLSAPAHNRRFFALLFATGGWLVLTGLQVTTVYLVGRPVGLAAALSVLTNLPFVLAFAALLLRVAEGIADLPLSTRLGRLGALAMTIAAVMAVIDSVKDVALMDLIAPEPHNPMEVMILAAFVSYTLYFGVVAVVFLTWLESERRRRDAAALALAREAEAKALLVATKAQAAASEARFEALRYQLNPHFLFNTLNAISSMVITGRNAVAEGMLEKLCAFLRTTLSAQNDPLVRLEDELSTTASYLEIEAFRLRERLDVAFVVPGHLNRVLVPGFILQPLVENAIKHGVGSTSRPVRLEIMAQIVGDTLVLDVRDDGRSDAPGGAVKGFGMGLANVRARLQSLYDENASLETSWLDPGFAATLRIPIAEAELPLEQSLPTCAS